MAENGKFLAADLADVAYQLGVLHARKGNLMLAAVKLAQCLDLLRIAHGPDSKHSTIVRALFALGQVRFVQGNLSKAVLLQRRCLRLLYALYGRHSAHPKIEAAQRALFLTLSNQGDWEKARTVCSSQSSCLRAEGGFSSTEGELNRGNGSSVSIVQANNQLSCYCVLLDSLINLGAAQRTVNVVYE